MATLVSKGDKPPYLVYSHKEYLNSFPPIKPQYDPATGETVKPRVRVKMNRGGGPTNIEITELDICNRTYNCLKKEGIVFAFQAAMRSDAELLRLYMFGRTSLSELRYALRVAGFPDGRWVFN